LSSCVKHHFEYFKCWGEYAVEAYMATRDLIPNSEVYVIAELLRIE
jgi:hypothetical protein